MGSLQHNLALGLTEEGWHCDHCIFDGLLSKIFSQGAGVIENYAQHLLGLRVNLDYSCGLICKHTVCRCGSKLSSYSGKRA